MKYNFCTLFNSNYLTKGLAMYQSLNEHFTDFCLYIFPFDEKCLEILKKLNLPKVVVVSLKEFEDPELLKIKTTRTPKEYCWTCSAATTWHTIKTYNLDNITYIDADLFFVNSPEPLIQELTNDSILITEHRYRADHDKTATSGKYCVQFMTFKNTEEGLTTLSWWRNACLDWCYDRHEDGKFGDQKYLDDWPTRFTGVHELQHLGGGLATWNMRRFSYQKKNGHLLVTDQQADRTDPLIFYHFHGVRLYKIFGKVIATAGNQKLDPLIKELYRQYARTILKTHLVIKKIEPEFNLGFNPVREYFRVNLLGKIVPLKIKKNLKLNKL